MASGWKRLAEIALARGGASSLAARVHGRRTVLLAYHNIVPEGSSPVGDLSLHVDQKVFGDHLDWLTFHAEIVPLSEAIRPRPSAASTRLRVAITFDDAYRGSMTAGVAELRSRGLPATVFVPPGLLGTEGFWWDRLARGGAPLDSEVREHALHALGGQTDRISRWADSTGRKTTHLPAHALPVTEAELLEVDDEVRMTFGAHTWSHPNLAAISPDMLDFEFARSKEWLASRTKRYVNWLAYPYGLHNKAVIAAASRHFDGALLVEGGMAERRGHWDHPVHATPRLNIPRGLSLDGLVLRLAGLVT